MKWSALSIFSALAFLTGSAHADWEFGNKLTLGYQFFYSTPISAPTDFQKSAPQGIFEPSFQWSNPKSRIKFKALLGYDASFAESKDRTIAIPEEFFFETRRGRNNWILGVNTFNWGVTDIINPLDVLNTRSYRNLLAPTKIGSPAISWNYARDSWSLEMAYIPVQIDPQLPGYGTRFFPQGESLVKFASEDQTAQIIPPANEGLRYHLKDRELYDEPFKNNFGLKLRAGFGKLETHWVGFEGHPGLPNFEPRPFLDSPISLNPDIFPLLPDFDIVPQYQRIRMGGLGLVYSADSWIFKLAHAQVWKTKTNYQTSNPTEPLRVAQPKTTVVAIEKPVAVGSLENTLLLQVTAQSDPEQEKESALSTRPIYDGSFIVGLRTASSLDWSTTFGILTNPTAKVNLLTYDFLYRWNDRVQLQLNGQHLAGEPGTIVHALAAASNTNLNIISTW